MDRLTDSLTHWLTDSLTHWLTDGLGNLRFLQVKTYSFSSNIVWRMLTITNLRKFDILFSK